MNCFMLINSPKPLLTFIISSRTMHLRTETNELVPPQQLYFYCGMAHKSHSPNTNSLT